MRETSTQTEADNEVALQLSLDSKLVAECNLARPAESYSLPPRTIFARFSNASTTAAATFGTAAPLSAA